MGETAFGSQTCLDTFQVDALTVEVYATAKALATAAAEHVVQQLQIALNQSAEVGIIFATGRSQRALLKYLRQKHSQTVDWSSVVGLHLDEYLGLGPEHPASFRQYLHQHIVQHLPFKAFKYLDGTSWEPMSACQHYAALLRQIQPSVCLLGIGDNGHLAFNDPPVADFNDPSWVKVVKLDPQNRQQQVNSGEFPNLTAVPQYGLTLTLSAIDSVPTILCLAPGQNKAKIIKTILEGPIAPQCPASMLRKHAGAKLLVDQEAVRDLYSFGQSACDTE